MLEICIQTPNDQNVQLILKSYLPVVYGTPFWSKKTKGLKEDTHNLLRSSIYEGGEH